jgi:hypothetical protein
MSPDEHFLAQLLGALAEVRLEAIVVGSGSAAMQGAPIMTEDVDLLIRDTPRKRQKLEALCELTGASLIDISPLANGKRLAGLEVNVDILFDVLPGGRSFESLRSRSVRVRIGKETAVVASLADVIASKQAANRPKDRAQLPILRDTLRVHGVLDRKTPPRRRPRRR